MEDSINFARTEKGRGELLGTEHALKQRQRQVLFLINDATSVGALREKLPGCQELESILELLWQEGFIGQVKSASPRGTSSRGAAAQAGDNKIRISDALNLLGKSRLEAARQYALGIVVSLIGERSPAYAKLANAADVEAFRQAVIGSRKMLAAVASAQQAQAFEQGVFSILNLPASDHLPPSSPNPNPARLNGIESAKAHALEIVRSLVGERSPVYAKLNDAQNRADFASAVVASKKVIAAVASTAKANNFEQEVLARMAEH
ncbi:MAG: hypothetical protein B7Y41_05065 [Hydrogenophilales bacterium 28-61-23]|nr:MAG: hypothetical protein B7Y41_05065 [Hydrogenophilales bacterium 28-61-23]